MAAYKKTSRSNRRCHGHDYRSRCIYLITILKSQEFPPFSHITSDPARGKFAPLVHISPLGAIIREQIETIPVTEPRIKILNKIIMPDHIHMELFVMEALDRPLGCHLAAFKSACTKAANSTFNIQNSTLPSAPGRDHPLFESGFNDKIAFRAGAKDGFYTYISDNPRRYLIKKYFPDLFFQHKMLRLPDNEGRIFTLGLYGNLLLLDNPCKSAVKISRNKERMPDLPAKLREWDETIRCGGVLVSPFINPEEKKIRDKAIAEETGIILIVNHRYGDRAKPYASLFDLCATGKLLIVSTEQYDSPPRHIAYREAQAMNWIARHIAALAPGQATLIDRPAST